jgi:hypothetical protein
MWLYGNGSAAWLDDSTEVTSVVFFEQDGAWYAAVAGHSESSTRDSKTNATRTSRYPHVSTYRLADGERVARRQYAPVYFRFDYVDDVVRVLGARDGKLWVVSTDPEESLHAVSAPSLEESLPWADLAARLPELSSGVFTKDGERPVWSRTPDGPFLFRLVSGPVMELDPAKLAVKAAPDGLDVRHAEEAAGGPYGDRRVEKVVEAQADMLEAEVAYTIGASIEPDAPGVSYVIHQSGLDREAAHIFVSRWDVGKDGKPVRRWVTEVPDVRPDCCNRRAVRTAGQAVLWYERWLIALDDESGRLAWAKHL